MTRILLALFMLSGVFASAQNPMPADKKATKETVKLYQNLIELKKKGLMFGHQDDLAYGEGWYGEKGRSDVKDVCGDYPAVYGWEIGHLELGDEYSLDSVYFKDIQNWIKTVYERGGINTMSWHLRNPYTGGSSWDVSSKKVVAAILPGGEKHELFVSWLDELANFLNGLESADGTKIPILFRPFHEHTGSWFWWGRNLCSVDEYKALWRFTVDYLQNKKEIHHLLFTYSTDRFKTEAEYLERYPGDEIVDVLGFDLYDRGSYYKGTLKSCAEKVTKLAVEKGKVATVSETGGPIATNHEWWTEVLDILKPYELSYVLVWRNPFRPTDHGNFAPCKGSPDSDNFIEFYNDPHTIFQKELTSKQVYK
ncbi:glycosyl hydrolase [Draconibacterium sp. IB214405]|uniref:glycoside hydrolase family 26 protein n=1 Tax=Draconibacterium sp. IB214405 TaxID=3097352 RepID=UPI002A1452DC|nr:glycosyl hydrolase [Draconibacterium sp. IB214405]MDX8340711.1 glycosyl hydrolase [Draconibacterium sp. IB214405]